MQSAQHKIIQHQQYTFLLIAGPTSYSNILNGFKVKEILPTGGGKNGEWFGSYLASPTLLFSALKCIYKNKFKLTDQ